MNIILFRYTLHKFNLCGLLFFFANMFTLYGVYLLILVVSARQTDRCFLDRILIPHQLPGMCGCTGISPSLNRRFNVILPPHAGTGTLAMVLDEIVKIKSCVHEHTDLAVHQQQLEGLTDYCGKHKRTGSVSVGVPTTSPAEFSTELCGTMSSPEFLVAIARNPYSRLITGFHFVSEQQQKGYEKLQKPAMVKAFREFVRYGASHYIKPLSKMLIGNDGVFVNPDFVINNLSPEQYMEDLNNLVRVLGFGNNITLDAIRTRLHSGFGHHIRHDKSFIVSPAELFDDATAAITISRYRDDFELFNFERNFSKALVP
jgi:hypothetical protein